MGVHVAYKNEEDPIKSEGTGVVTTFSHIISLWGFFKILKGSLLINPWSDPADFQIHLSFYGCPCYMKE